LLLICITFLYYRVFCFYACPIGLLQDIVPSFKRSVTFLNKTGKLNYILFVLLFFISLFSVNALGLFDPLVIYARAVNAFIDPLPMYYGWFLLPIIGIIVLNIISKRLWCYYLCPLGAFFDGCNDIKTALKKNNTAPVNQKRRSVLASAIGGVLVGFGLSKAGSAYADKQLIRPPGALAESDFKKACLRCGNCIKACITKGLQPALFESGWDGMFSPRLIPRIGECDEYCNRCGNACPTGAIRSLPLEIKRNVQLGIAKVEKGKCLGWSGNKLCLICGEYCPYLAIEKHMKNGKIPCPIIKEDICRGCGLCEKQCPTHAIKVFQQGRRVML